MIKKNRKWIVGILAFCLIWCVSVPVSVYALNPDVLIYNAYIQNDSGNAFVESVSNRNLYYIDLGNSRSGTINLTFNASSRGYILFSNDDIPNNISINYYFISSNYTSFRNILNTSYDFTDIRYIYLSPNYEFTYTITYSDPDPTPTYTPTPTDTPTPTPSPEPTDPINPPEPTNTPTPIPTGSDGYGIPLEYLIPFDYYMIAIIILLGGILICQLFKN